MVINCQISHRFFPLLMVRFSQFGLTSFQCVAVWVRFAIGFLSFSLTITLKFPSLYSSQSPLPFTKSSQYHSPNSKTEEDSNQIH